MLGVGRAVSDVHVLKPAGDQQVLQRVWMERPDVRDVADVALEKREPAGRVDRFEHDGGAWAQLVEGKVPAVDDNSLALKFGYRGLPRQR